mgnify:CR=1 FL=1
MGRSVLVSRVRQGRAIGVLNDELPGPVCTYGRSCCRLRDGVAHSPLSRVYRGEGNGPIEDWTAGLMRRAIVAAVAILALIAAGCSTDATATDEYQALEQELASTIAELDAVTFERDALVAEDEKATARYEKAKANQDVLLSVIEDPTAFGTEEEVLDLLDAMATPDVVSGDLAFGGTSTGIWRTGWRNTLFNDTDAVIHTWRSWLAEDGSVGGSLWSWIGTAGNGEPFSLEGLELSRFNDEGLYTEVIMLYPYEDTEVHRRTREGN